VVSKDRAPTPEELQQLLDAGDLREKVIVTLTALGGFREGTLTILTYGHVKKDFEQGIIPVHVHISMDETKGKYADFDTFLGPEAINYLKLSLEQRRNGSNHRSDQEYLPPEEINDDSPLIRDASSKTPRGISPKQIYKQIHDLYHKTGLDTKNKNGGYELRVHSLRKYFKTRLVASGVPESHADYMMGHVTDTYNQVQSLGIEKLRSVYKNADLSIRTDSKNGKVDFMRQMLRSLGATPDEMAEAFKSFTEPNKIYMDPEEQAKEEMQGFMTVFVNKFSDRLKNQQLSALKSPGP
jgi:integrase